jgi:hypothetical protein
MGMKPVTVSDAVQRCLHLYNGPQGLSGAARYGPGAYICLPFEDTENRLFAACSTAPLAPALFRPQNVIRPLEFRLRRATRSITYQPGAFKILLTPLPITSESSDINALKIHCKTLHNKSKKTIRNVRAMTHL